MLPRLAEDLLLDESGFLRAQLLLVLQHILLLVFLVLTTLQARNTMQFLVVSNFELVAHLALNSHRLQEKAFGKREAQAATRLLYFLVKRKAFGAPRVGTRRVHNCLAGQEEVVVVDAREAQGSLPMGNRERLAIGLGDKFGTMFLG